MVVWNHTQVKTSMLALGACERVKKLARAHPVDVIRSPILQASVSQHCCGLLYGLSHRNMKLDAVISRACKRVPSVWFGASEHADFEQQCVTIVHNSRMLQSHSLRHPEHASRLASCNAL